MERILLQILARLRAQESLDAKELDRILNEANKQAHSSTRRFAKKRIFPYYLHVKQTDPARWASWQVTPELEQRLVQAVRMKPRRTASGVATITVLTKPAHCASACRYCPADVRMPKSYLADEPACQRAERNWFDPYLQVASRLRALEQMGHITDKVELIVLGGTWCDYPPAYQIWVIRELFRALNQADGPEADAQVQARRAHYRQLGISNDPEVLAARAVDLQQAVSAGTLSYNRAVDALYGTDPAWQQAATDQQADRADLEACQRINEQAAHRAVGLAVETRPDTVTPERLRLLRQLGCTKVQMGVQSLNSDVLAASRRTIGPDQIARAFGLARLFGFKIHAHFMVNLPGATPASDKADYRRFVTEAPYQPDEVKLYPCALIDGSALVADWRAGRWTPYTEGQLLDVLAADTLATPAFTRVSRMIRDFSADDIVAGNKKGNLRQLVEARVQRERAATGQPVAEIRAREIGTQGTDRSQLHLEQVAYRTPETRERFLQWVDDAGRIAGFLRLSLPDEQAVRTLGAAAPVAPGEAMIRELHVYGAVAGIGHAGTSAQHTGLGRALVERACQIAAREGYERLNVISSVGTRDYYRHLGFADAGLYQQKLLEPAPR